MKLILFFSLLFLCLHWASSASDDCFESLPLSTPENDLLQSLIEKLKSKQRFGAKFPEISLLKHPLNFLIVVWNF